jgi:hypothetical protein
MLLDAEGRREYWQRMDDRPVLITPNRYEREVEAQFDPPKSWFWKMIYRACE